MIHPLAVIKSQAFIENLEDALSIRELIGMCKFNILVYEYNKNYENQLVDATNKFKAYREYLAFLLSLNYKYNNTKAKTAYWSSDIIMEYKETNESI